MAPKHPDDVRGWLATRPALHELQEAFPKEWASVQEELAGVSERGDLEELKARVLAVPPASLVGNRRDREPAGRWTTSLARSAG